MKRWLLAAVLTFACVSPALAVSTCWPNNPVNVGPGRSLSFVQLQVWWNTYGVPQGSPNPHVYVATKAADHVCKVAYGASAWAQHTAPNALATGSNAYTISQGAWFQCRKCPDSPTYPVPRDR